MGKKTIQTVKQPSILGSTLSAIHGQNPVEELNNNDEQATTAKAQEALEFGNISIDLIDDPEAPMRSDITPASVEELVLSIKQVGIIEPLVVKEKNNRYEVIAGHRRLFSSKIAKLATVPCYIKKANSEQTEMLKIHENLYRADVKPADEAKHYSHLIDKQKLTPTQIAQIIGRSLSYVTDRLEILNYPDFLSEALDKQEISFSVAREFARFDDTKQMHTAVYYAKRGGMTQEMARKWVQDYKRSKDQQPLTANQVVNESNGVAEIEHSAKCVYCQDPVKLLEAAIVYMHNECLREANNIASQPSASS